MSVQITDCTIRDGGYLFHKNPEPEFVKAIMNALVDAGIDFVETGFLQTNCNGETIVYHDSKEARKFLPERTRNTNFLGFCDNSRYSVNDLDEYDGTSFKWLRISFAKHELDASLEFCAAAQNKGYIVQFNPMDAISYSDEEREDLIDKVNKIKPGSLSIVDTFGAMYLEDFIHIFKHMDSLLDKDIKMGLHSHDNLGLSCALAELMVSLGDECRRDIIIDGSLMGMGRGAGNASTELLAAYLNEKHGANYNIPVLLDVIEKYIIPLKDSIIWGYDLPMFVCGAKHSHVDNVYYLQRHTDCSASDIYKIIDSLSPAQRIRYGVNYSTSDFTDLENALIKFKEKG